MISIMKNNLFYFQWYKILFLTMLIDPIFVIYAYSEGLSANQIFILTSIEAVLIMLLEVPTGVISDLFGYKISMVLSVFCFIVSNIILIIFPTFAGFLLCEIFIALYKVFASGADETYLYLILDNKDDYTKVAGKLDSIHFILSGIFSISIGYLYAINKRYPFVISIIICTLALLMVVRLENVREYKKDIKTVKELSEEFFANQRRGFELICKSKKLRWFIAYSAVISFALVAIMQTYQLYFSARGIPVQYFGLIYFLLYLVSSVSSRLAHHFKGFHEYKMFMALLLMLTLTPLLMAFPAEILIVTIIIPRIIIGIYPSVMKEYMNKEIKMDRATIFSIRSLVSKVPQVVLLPFVGYVIDDKGLSYSLVMIFICLSVAGGILLGSYYRGKIM